MARATDSPEYECTGGGPYDGSLVSCPAHRLEVHQFVGSPFVHVYELVNEDTGGRVWMYRGAYDAAEPRRAA